MTINSYEQLKTYLKNFRMWNHSDENTYEMYDFVGMIHLLGACLDNLKTNGVESELERIDEILSDDQLEFAASLFRKKIGSGPPSS